MVMTRDDNLGKLFGTSKQLLKLIASDSHLYLSKASCQGMSIFVRILQGHL